MISVAGLIKRYGDFTAVAGSDFDVEAGEVFGIVGPNGAGKTTTLKILAGLIEPSAGTATVAGYDVADSAMRSVLGFLPEESPLYEDMTPLSYLHFFADLYDVPREIADERIDRTLSRLSLHHRTRRLGDMSKGMKRKVAITRSLINDPEVLIYDEPASGLDPLTTNEVLNFVGELAASGKTVLFSAHNLYHVEDICDRVIVMIDGEIVARGTVPAIRETHGTTEYHVYTTVPVEKAEPAVARSEGATSVRNGHETDQDLLEDGERYETVVSDMAAVEALRERARTAGGRVVDIRTVEPSFEEIFLDIARPAVGADS
jgi:ABC-2 type transport system ATP-binding protein